MGALLDGLPGRPYDPGQREYVSSPCLVRDWVADIRTDMSMTGFLALSAMCRPSAVRGKPTAVATNPT